LKKEKVAVEGALASHRAKWEAYVKAAEARSA